MAPLRSVGCDHAATVDCSVEHPHALAHGDGPHLERKGTERTKACATCNVQQTAAGMQQTTDNIHAVPAVIRAA